MGEISSGIVAPPKLELATTIPTTLPRCFLNHCETIITFGPSPDITRPNAMRI